MLSEKPSMRSLRDLIQSVAPNYYDIALELGLELRYVRIVERDNPNSCVRKCQQIFEKFLERGNVTWREVLHSIRRLNLNTIVHDIEKQLPGQDKV